MKFLINCNDDKMMKLINKLHIKLVLSFHIHLMEEKKNFKFKNKTWNDLVTLTLFLKLKIRSTCKKVF